MAKILIVCGGTGGHLTPGIAIADTLQNRGHLCTLVVSRKKVDSRLIRNYPDMNFVNAPGAPFSWNPIRLIQFLWAQCHSFIFALKLLTRIRPDLTLGFGGFLSAGIALPGCLKGIPFVLHEANRVVGRSNRILSRFADQVFLPVGIDLPRLKPGRVFHVGLPLRKEFFPIKKEEARARLNLESTRRLLVVFGGSQGASSLNNWAFENCPHLAEQEISVYCLTGLNNEFPKEVMHESSSHGPVHSRFVPFSDLMPAVLSAADVVISRAGAGSIAEIIRCGTPAILVPYPFARDDHQTANAKYLLSHEAAVLIEDSQLEKLFGMVADLFSSSHRLKHLGNNLKSLDHPEEASMLADKLEELFYAKFRDQPPAKLQSKQV
ncbi:MAG: UDP-N-acetylglucosamine--N-acetylmuramyl-(pentapeptide) pyrophosphoryl-undecaprenol N-acetylglucosamine transferase [Opitutaceae bacterium]|nr:UDP-N-acetylglucosamine--N-acetylmuramyl-(pentapeptide) pyrophosphoryl-undecaprenol N-acetylglucosamine transferase [Opitutaceae bacterium]